MDAASRRLLHKEPCDHDRTPMQASAPSPPIRSISPTRPSLGIAFPPIPPALSSRSPCHPPWTLRSGSPDLEKKLILPVPPFPKPGSFVPSFGRVFFSSFLTIREEGGSRWARFDVHVGGDVVEDTWRLAAAAGDGVLGRVERSTGGFPEEQTHHRQVRCSGQAGQEGVCPTNRRGRKSDVHRHVDRSRKLRAQVHGTRMLRANIRKRSARRR